MGASFRLGRLFGVEIGIHASWLIIAFFVTYSLAVFQLPEIAPDWSPLEYWVVAAVIAALFFASVVAHELSHALVARRYGLTVQSITLFILGGAAELKEEPRQARHEAAIAAAGPVTSLIIGGVMAGVDLAVPIEHVSIAAGWLAIINIALGLFNLLPGFPMDGGRILRALVWRMGGDRDRATRTAATVGRFFGYAFIALGVYVVFQRGLGGIWLALIGWFLTTAADGSLSQLRVERALAGVRVRDIMDADPPSVSPNDLVSELVGERLLKGDDRSFLVRYDDGGLAGLVTLSDVRRLPREQWELARVTDIMTRRANLATVAPEDEAGRALELLQEREIGQLPVIVEEHRPVGMLTRSGLLRAIDTRRRLGF
jgi:Zn-dependent protease/CBS domain-containing protein